MTIENLIDRADQPDAIAVSVDDAAKMVSLSRTAIYDLLAQGVIVSVKHGRRRLVVVASLHAFLDGLPRERAEE